MLCGTFEDAAKSQLPVSRACKDTSKCSDDEYEIKAPTETSDRVCEALTKCDSSE